MRLSIIRNSQRGVTLVELVIVIALVSIVAVSVGLLTASMQRIVTNNEQATNEMDNLTMARDAIERWFYLYDDSEYTYTISNEEQTKITVKENEVTIASISLDENDNETLIFMKNEVTSYTYKFSGLTSILFENVGEGNTKIFRCTFIYNTKDAENKKFSFLLSLKCAN